MYIVEKIIKLYKKFKSEQQTYSPPENQDTLQLEDILTCKHNFMPIDSTGEILACSKCGYVVNRKRLKKR